MKPDWTELSHRYGLTGPQIARLQQLHANLKTVNDRNLTAVTSDSGIFNIHFLDSLSLLGFPELNQASRVVDVGSGAGFPGLPLAIALPRIDFTLVESNKRKCEFSNSSIASIGICNAHVENVRAEDLGNSSSRGIYDVALARAVASLPVVLEYTVPLLKIGGHALLQRGARSANDYDNAVAASSIIGADLLRIVPLSPYRGAKNLHVWVFKKVRETPGKYPRRSGIPSKKPLGS